MVVVALGRPAIPRQSGCAPAIVGSVAAAPSRVWWRLPNSAKAAMPIVEPRELKTVLGREQRLMGLDVGTKTIGLALSDVLRTVATPYATIRRVKFTPDAAELFRIIDHEGVGGLVVGLPVEMSGEEGSRCQSVRAFVSNLLKLRDLPVSFWDERLSTAAVTRTLLEADASRRRRAAVVDKMAAAYILQGLLDAT